MQKNRTSLSRVALSAVALSVLMHALPAGAVGEMPDKRTCEEAKNPVIAGGCIATDKERGNCMACHQFSGLQAAGLTGGDLAPSLVAIKERHPDKKRLRALIWDASQFNADTIMPPYGKYRILTEREIERVIEWLYSL